MYPILGRYGSFFFYSYTLALGAGLLIAVALTSWQARRRGKDLPWLDGLLIAVAAGLVGGRVAYVATNWGYFQSNWDETWLVWQGGLSYHGALVAGLLSLWAFCRARRQPFGQVAGLLAAPAVLWSVSGWLACYLTGCAYGRETLIGLLAADLPDSYGVFAVRYQTQLLGILFHFVAFLVVWQLRLRPLLRFWLALFLVSITRFVITFLRGDPTPMLSGIRLDTLLDGGLALLAAGAIFLSARKPVAQEPVRIPARAPQTESKIELRSDHES